MRPNLCRELAQDGGFVSGASADLEDAVCRLDRERLDHRSHDVRLGHGLPRVDGQREVAIGLGEALGWGELFAWHFGHCCQDALIADAACAQLFLHHAMAHFGDSCRSLAC